MPRIYFDNAATSWPKPESVYQAVDSYQRELGVAAGRGAYQDAERVHRVLARCRLAIATLIRAQSPDEIIFTQNCTDSLNLAIHGLLQPGDHAVTTMADHNSVLRPLHAARTRGVEVTTIPLGPDGVLDVDRLAQVVASCPVRLIAINHVSNVTGTRQPIEEVAAIAQAAGCTLLLDAAQSLGHELLDVDTQGIDMLAAPGHKALWGPLGTGILYVRKQLHASLAAIRQGGTGTESELAEQPETAPYKYESGNLNVPGIVGLDAGVTYVQQHQISESTVLLELTGRLCEALADEQAITLYSRPNRYGIVSFRMDGMMPSELATLLDGMAQIQVRAGLHCAPEMHRALGTLDGGTVRVSLGHFSNAAEVDTLVSALQTLIANPLR